MTSAPPHSDPELFAQASGERLAQERQEVAAQYDHDHEVFSLVLDRRLAYTTGVFLDPDEDLEIAQARSSARMTQKLAIQPGERVLDIGCGWGSNILYLAEHTLGTFHGITLSAKQRADTLARARAMDLSSRVRIDVCHVEELGASAETYDVVLFSGSLVHVHDRSAIHANVARWLKPGGRLLISDCYYPEQIRGDRESSATQFIFAKALSSARLLGLGEELTLIERAGLDVSHVEDLTRHYVLTLGRWIDNVRMNRREIEELAPGFSTVLQSFMRIARSSFARRTALQYMILACKGHPSYDVGAWRIP